MPPTLWSIRSKSSENDVSKLYEGFPNIFTMRIQHGGLFSKSPGRRYVFGKLNYVDFIDIDEFSVHELYIMFEELGYPREACRYYHFCIPGTNLDIGLLPLGNDADVIRLSRYVAQNKEIRVYSEHGKTFLTTYSMSPTKVVIEEIEDEIPSPELNRCKKRKKDSGSCSKKLAFDLNIQNPAPLALVVFNSQEQQSTEFPYHKFKRTQTEGDGVPAVNETNEEEQAFADVTTEVEQAQADVTTEEEQSQVDGVPTSHVTNEVEQVEMEFLDPLFDFGQQYEPDNHDIEEDYGVDILEEQQMGEEAQAANLVDETQADNEGDRLDDEDEGDSDYVMNEDDLVEDYEVDMSDFRSVVKPNVEWVPKDKQPVDTDHEEEDLEVIDEDKFEFAGYDEDPREALLKELKKPKHCSHGKVHGGDFFIGQNFQTKKEVTIAVKEHALKTRMALYTEKNDNIRVRVVCRGVSRESNVDGDGTCPWVLLVSRPSKLDTWTVKTYDDDHRCLNTRDVKSCTQSFIAKKIEKQLEMNPTCPISALQEEFQTKYGVNVSKHKIFRAKVIAQHEIHGDYEKQYTMLWDYVNELKARNPGTTVKIEVESVPNCNSPTRQFKRIYICLGALKQGFKESHREILGLDGTFMKGPYPGVLLTAVSVDSNNGMFPLAYAMVDGENTNSWSWFLECLREDLDLPTRANFTFISDRQKGILQAVEKIFPVAEHRFCVRHIHENMKKFWKGNALKEMFWKCATATTVIHFEQRMTELSVFNKAAYDWLRKIPAVHWARSHFTGRSHCQILLNNMCEIFNARLNDGRDKPIISSLEYIREYLMKRMCRVQHVIDKSLGPLTPTATKLLEKVEEEAHQLRVIFGGNQKYQVTGIWHEQFVVDMSERECSCRKWELTGIPCKHAVAVIWDMKQNSSTVDTVEDWVHEGYKLATWQNMYKVKVGPINGRDMWQKTTNLTTLTPPKHKKQVGRPKKKRVRGVDEVVSQGSKMSQGTKLTRKFLTVTCRKCNNKGHNARSCKGQGGEGEASVGGRRTKSKAKGKAAAV